MCHGTDNLVLNLNLHEDEHKQLTVLFTIYSQACLCLCFNWQKPKCHVIWVGVGHVRKHYIEFKCLLSLDLKDHPVPILYGSVKNCWHIPEFLHLCVTTVACETCQSHANILFVKQINVYAVYHQCTIVNICLLTSSLVMPEPCFMIIPEYWCREDMGWLSLFCFYFYPL